jgi:hypothetical protein
MIESELLKQYQNIEFITKSYIVFLKQLQTLPQSQTAQIVEEISKEIPFCKEMVNHLKEEINEYKSLQLNDQEIFNEELYQKIISTPDETRRPYIILKAINEEKN